MTPRPPRPAPAGAHPPLLAQLKVGTKLMLLVLLPVCVLIGFTSITAVGDWRTASQLDSFRTATRLAVATATAAGRVADERAAAMVARLRPGPVGRGVQELAQDRASRALLRAEDQAAGWNGPGAMDVTGRLSAAGRELSALRLRTAAGAISVPSIGQSYAVIVANLATAAGELLGLAPTPDSQRAADAYQAMVLAVEAAQRERVAVATSLATRARLQLPAASQWSALETSQLDQFRQNTTGRLAADLESVLFSPAGIRVQQVRGQLVSRPRTAIGTTSLGTWLDASGARIAGLRQLQRAAAAQLAGTASSELSTARASGIRDVSLLLAVLAAVTVLAMALRRSITRPLREVSAGARMLSGGDLDYDVSYAGRDEIGDVAAAFRDLRVTAERLAAEIRTTNAAISASRLDHRADVGGFEGTWAQLLAGMNDTTAEFARLHGRRRRAEREVADIFNLSLDLLCIAGTDGYFRRVNPAVERALGYTSEELLSRPATSFVHPDDRARTEAALAGLASGQDLVEFENRYVRSDGVERWLQWSARAVPDEGVSYAAARDVTDSRRASQEQAALRRVATLVARGVPPPQVFDVVVAELYQLLRPASAGLLRYAADGSVTAMATRGLDGSGNGMPGTGQLAQAVFRSGRAARTDVPAAGAPIIVEGQLWGVTAAVWRGDEPAPGIEARMAQFTELVAAAVANAQARTDLAASRARIVAASDQTRRQIERDLHDGAQQRLVSLRLSMRAAEAAVPPGLAPLRQDLAQVTGGLGEVLEELREMSRGIHPAILSEGGLRPALKGLARRSAVPVQLEVDLAGRLPEPVEVAAYFVVSEALANAAKYAGAAQVRVGAAVRDGVLEIVICDDGRGGADPAGGSGLIGLADRVEALGGSIEVSSPAGSGTRILVRLPVRDG